MLIRGRLFCWGIWIRCAEMFRSGSRMACCMDVAQLMLKDRWQRLSVLRPVYATHCGVLWSLLEQSKKKLRPRAEHVLWWSAIDLRPALSANRVAAMP